MLCYLRNTPCQQRYLNSTTAIEPTESILHQDMAASPSHLRSLYRSLLRELPHRPLSTPSPIQKRIRNTISSDSVPMQIEEAEQYIQYAKAQRMYATLLERYNPGMSMDEEEKVRLTARRVGMDLPEEWRTGKKI